MSDESDVVVVGAGTAGCVLAARLSTDPDRTIVLLEAGPDYWPGDVPAPLANGLEPDLSSHDWGLTVRGPSGRTVLAPRGKVVGGSSAVNTCIALRPEVGDLARWADLVDGETWSVDSLTRWFRAIEDDHDHHDAGHGRGGPVPIRRWRRDELTAASAAFVDGCRGLGHPWTDDLNRLGTAGVGHLPMNVVEGRRRSMAECHLAPARERENLVVRARSEVARILFDGTRAVGVELVGGEQVGARHVVLAAGAYASPTILLRSGVGPADELRRLDVAPVAIRAGVGADLHDHPQCYVPVVGREPIDPAVTPCTQVLLRYTSTVGRRANDMQLSLLNHVDIDSFSPELAAVTGGRPVLMLMTQLEDPVARGTVGLESAAPGAPVRIDLDYCSRELDRTRLREGVRLAWRLATQGELAAHVEEIVGVDLGVIADDDQLDDHVRQNVSSGHHPAGTCRMGRTTDPRSVVDATGAVIGTEGLTVADASIVPFPVRANLNLTCIVLAEVISTGLSTTCGR